MRLGLAYPNLDSVNIGGATGFTMSNCFHLIGADLVAIDNPHDVAVLKMKPNPFVDPPRSMISFGDVEGPTPMYDPCEVATGRPRDGEPVAVSGYPLDSPSLVTTSGNIASGWAHLGRQMNRDDGVYLADVAVNPGNSGGPVYRVSDGRVIGVCCAYRIAPLIFTDAQGGQATIEKRPVGLNSGLCVIAPIELVLTLVQNPSTTTT